VQANAAHPLDELVKGCVESAFIGGVKRHNNRFKRGRCKVVRIHVCTRYPNGITNLNITKALEFSNFARDD
jgi:hypothetical protein